MVLKPKIFFEISLEKNRQRDEVLSSSVALCKK